jgi:hypothetical protein
MGALRRLAPLGALLAARRAGRGASVTEDLVLAARAARSG